MSNLAPMKMAGQTIGFTFEETSLLTSKQLKSALKIGGEIYVHPTELELLYDIDDILITRN